MTAPTTPTRRQPRTVAATNKRRGAMVERVVADYLALHTGLPVERRRLEGACDRGDLAGIPDTVVEIKSGQPCLTAWLKETERERVNAAATVGVLWWAPPGLARTPSRHVVFAVGAIGKLIGSFPSPPLRVPALQLGWHLEQAPRYGVGGYWCGPRSEYASSGEHAASQWTWWRSYPQVAAI